MVRRNDKRELNPEDFLEATEESEEPDKIVEIFRGVKQTGEEETVGESNGLARQSADLSAQQADEQWEGRPPTIQRIRRRFAH